MGTLTGACPRLDAHCPHKLATSCRLTSTPNCCACADERPHSRLYRVYIDGIGFVQRGTRWQSYCWFCKEFWNNRLAATDPPLEVSQTRIPHIPDQTEFLERWFEFHRGFRIARHSDGTETRIAVIGEPFTEVSPGFLPRTLSQLRAGRENDASRPENRFRRRRLTSEDDRPAEPQQSIEDTLDDLLDAVSNDADREPETENETPPSHQPEANMPTIRARSSSSIQRTRDRFVRLFGSREDVQRDDYVSPLSNMYDRAEARYQLAEERRARGETVAPPTAVRETMTQRERDQIDDAILWGAMQESNSAFLDHVQDRTSSSAEPLEHRDQHTDASLSSPLRTTSAIRASLDQISSDLARLRQASEAVSSFRRSSVNRSIGSPIPTPGVSLDQPDRPAPMTEAQMTKKLDCQVCYSQLADIALLPCGHMVMCQWCADIVVPVRHAHIPVQQSRCPMCRKAVKQCFKIHMGIDDVVVAKDAQKKTSTAEMINEEVEKLEH